MACLPIARSGVAPILGIRTGFPGRRSSSSAGGVLTFRCCRREDDTGSDGKPQWVLTKQLRFYPLFPGILIVFVSAYFLFGGGGGGGCREGAAGVAVHEGAEEEGDDADVPLGGLCHRSEPIPGADGGDGLGGGRTSEG